MKERCLFIIDVQNGFVSDKTSYVVERIKDLLEKNVFDHVLFTKFINEEGSPYRKFLNWSRLSTSEEQSIPNEIVKYASNIIEKTVYTGVNDETLNFFHKHNIEEVHLLGIDTDCCVLKTAVDLFEHNIRPIVLEHYSASNGGEQSHQSALTVLSRLIGSHNIKEGPIV